ncbi:MAG TPA: DNA primase [Rhodocyclaceae bacterium]|nr:DNA primase [Rhodocyclaceae bacterium]
MIPESFIQDLLARIDVVDLIDSFVPLKKAGANFSACCPFHNEKTPSFTVSPSKQFYHCFGCGAHGTSIGFMMQYSGLDFVEAVKELANRAGMQVPEEEFKTKRREGSADLREVMALASRFFREQLKQSPKAIDYLKQRGLTGEIAARFGIGYAPDAWQGLEGVFPRYDAAELQTAGLIIKNEAGRIYDRFRDRVMFPIQNAQGEVIAFGGRVIGQGEPKYLNSPETPLFEKGRELFGLPQARAGLRAQNTAIVVEGYMDVVALAQHGVDNAVATLGTATTPTHVQKLLRQVDRIIFCFDGDNAGRKAAWRALENALETAADDKWLGFAFLPSEHDPDSYVRELGADAFRELLKASSPLSEYFIQELSRRAPPDSAEGRSLLLHEAKPLLARLKAPALRLQIVQRLAELARISSAEAEKLCDLQPLVQRQVAPKRAPRRAPSLARKIGLLLMSRPALARDLDHASLPSGDQEADALRELHLSILDRDLRDGSNIASLIEHLRNSGSGNWVEQLSGELLNHPLSEEEIDSEWSDTLEHLQHRTVSSELAELTAQARAGGLDEAGKKRLLELLRTKASRGN